MKIPVLIAALFLAACSQFVPPKVSTKLIAAAPDNDARELEHGRTLFLNRCLQCHTLPAVTKYSAAEWPGLVRGMAARAELNAEQEREIIAYLRAASALGR